MKSDNISFICLVNVYDIFPVAIPHMKHASSLAITVVATFRLIPLSHNHHFKWWFGLALIRACYMLTQKGGDRKHYY